MANRIDGLLAQRPELLGESREGSVRVAFEEHLGFEFEVLMQDRIVYVLAIWPLR